MLEKENCLEEGKPTNPMDLPFLVLLRNTIAQNAGQIYATWYDSSGKAVNQYTFQEIWDEAGVIASYLQHEWGVRRGERVILCYNFGLHFFASFLACLRAGITAVLVYPPGLPLVKSLSQLNRIVGDCSPAMILTDSDVSLLKTTDGLNPLSKSRNMWPKDIPFRRTDGLGTRFFGYWKTGQKEPFNGVFSSPSDIAFLQYTSGSTGDPKGVMISYEALSAQVSLLHNGFHDRYGYLSRGVDGQQLVGFSWLPMYHDMGLVVGTIAPFAAGMRMHMMSPVDFIRNPLLWLELMSKHRVNWGVAPDFAYNLVARKFMEAKARRNGQSPIADLDLCCVGHLSNAAEPVRLPTIQLFAETFEPYGLSADYGWLHCCYGLAEHVVAASYVHGLYFSAPREDREDTLVASGVRANFEDWLDIKIVDPKTMLPVPDGTTGEIWISGPSVGSGYFGRFDLTEEVFRAQLADGSSGTRFLRTGDLGFFENDSLFICGRIKDLIIRNGVNYYPQDIEYIVQTASDAVRPGCVAAFSSNETGDDGDLQIVFEIRRSHEGDAAQACQDVRRQVIASVGLAPSRVVAIRERTINKTTSGKIQRRASRLSLSGDKYDVVFDLEQPVFDASLGNGSSSIIATGEPDSMVDVVQDPASIVDLEENTEMHGDSQNFDTIIHQYLGQDCDLEQTWEELGMSSLVSVQIHDALEKTFLVTLSPDWQQTFPTLAALKSHLHSSSGKPLPIHLPVLQKVHSTRLNWLSMSLFQAFGVIMLLFLFAAPIIPAWHAIEWAKTASTVELFNVNGRWLVWLWVPLSIPVWAISFSLLVILSKWLVVGRNRECEIETPSVAFLRWWWVDRAVHMWEFWVGRFLMDTWILWLFYRLFGANIHPSAKLKGLIREFDLVEIGAGAEIEHQIRCRKFGPWKLDGSSDGPSLRFRRVLCARNARIRGMLSPGVRVEEGAFVERMSVVPEGAHVAKGICVKGNPAVESGEAPPYSLKTWWWKFEVVKVAWLLVEMYHFFALLLVVQLMIQDRLPEDWRYTPLCYWFLFVVISAILLLATSIMLKWAFIGKRHPGSKHESLWTSVAEWVTDYRFRISTVVLMSLSSNSIFWNVVLRLFGMDIDFGSKIIVSDVPPSKVDLISVKNSSFLSSGLTFDVEKEGEYHRTEITESSIGYGVVVGPGLTLSRAVVPPNTHVQHSISNKELDSRCSSSPVSFHVGTSVLYILMIGAAFGSLIPVYELWYNVLKPSSVYKAVPVLALTVTVQTIVWVIVLWALQIATYGFSRKLSSPWSESMFSVYVTFCWSIQVWSFLSLLWGTPFFSMVARSLGATIEGRLLYFGREIFDLNFVTVASDAVLDDALVNGHFAVYRKVQLGPNHLSGVLHPGTMASVGAEIVGSETGPWRAVFGSGRSQKC